MLENSSGSCDRTPELYSDRPLRTRLHPPSGRQKNDYLSMCYSFSYGAEGAVVFLCCAARTCDNGPRTAQEPLLHRRDGEALLPPACTHQRSRVGVFGLLDKTTIFRQVLVQLRSKANVSTSKRRIRTHNFIVQVHSGDRALEPRGVLNREEKLGRTTCNCRRTFLSRAPTRRAWARV